MDAEWENIGQIMEDVHGMDVSMYDANFLQHAIEKRCESVRIPWDAGYRSYLAQSSDEAKQLMESLTITYTVFFRNVLTYAHLEQWILPGLIERKSGAGELRIWSAGCSTGQEAYSIAMLMETLTGKKACEVPYRIIATDISEPALAAAERGVYTMESMENVRTGDAGRYFVKTGDRYMVHDRLKKHVSFSYYNLLDDLSSYPQESIFGNFDLVVCCNVLYYYQPVYQHFILKKLMGAMTEKGYLITGEAERHIAAESGGLRSVAPPSPIFRKYEVQR